MPSRESGEADRFTIVADCFDGQRLDNFLLREWRGVPRSHIYRLLRVGRVRLNTAKARPDSRLAAGDRLDFLSLPVRESPPSRPARALRLPALYEDDALLAVDKPGGIAVHGGSGVAHGVIERLRLQHPSLELVHRLDRGTSGVLLLAKKRSALRSLQSDWRRRRVQKQYAALCFGVWREECREIDRPLKRVVEGDQNRRVIVSEEGKTATTRTRILRQWRKSALVAAEIATGRTHQLRVHLAHVGLPIVGDDKYGAFSDNRKMAGLGHERLFLHAERLIFTHPVTGKRQTVVAPPPADFSAAAAAFDATT